MIVIRLRQKRLEEELSQLKWFEGNTLTVYHGGRWDGRTRIKVTGRGALGVGAYFSPNSQVAADYARDSGLDYLVQCELNLANPLTIEEAGHFHPAIQALIQLGEDKAKAIRLINAAEAKMGYPGEQLRSRAMAAGHDSLIRKHNGGIYEIVIWNPKLVVNPKKLSLDDNVLQENLKDRTIMMFRPVS